MAEKSEQDVRQEVEELLREIELQREVAQQQGRSFSARSEEELYRKVRGEESSSSPFIFAQAFNPLATPGSKVAHAVYMSNPDPINHYPLYFSIFFGLANFLNNIGEGLSGRDQRWPLLSSDAFGIAPGKLWNVFLDFKVPYVPLSTYHGNGVLWGANEIDKGVYYDRCLLPITLQ